jgi:CheY-like chemotaxis protein
MNGEHILVVEDDRLALSLLGAKIGAQGYRVTRAATIAEALCLTRHEMPALLVLDLKVLDDDPFSGLTDGFAFLSLLRRNHPEARIPVVIYSIDDSPAVRTKAKALGVAAVVSKRQPMTELLAVIRKTLDEAGAPPGPCLQTGQPAQDPAATLPSGKANVGAPEHADI